MVVGGGLVRAALCAVTSGSTTVSSAGRAVYMCDVSDE